MPKQEDSPWLSAHAVVRADVWDP